MVKHTQTIRRLLATNCLSLFDNFVSLALKGLIKELDVKNIFIHLFFTKSLKRAGKKRNKCDWLTFRQSFFKKKFMRIPECFQKLLPISTKGSNTPPSVNFSELDFFLQHYEKNYQWLLIWEWRITLLTQSLGWSTKYSKSSKFAYNQQYTYY